MLSCVSLLEIPAQTYIGNANEKFIMKRSFWNFLSGDITEKKLEKLRDECCKFCWRASREVLMGQDWNFCLASKIINSNGLSPDHSSLWLNDLQRRSSNPNSKNKIELLHNFQLLPTISNHWKLCRNHFWLLVCEAKTVFVLLPLVRFVQRFNLSSCAFI